MEQVLSAIRELTPRTQPVPYQKRWWNLDLTALRRQYNECRNHARRIRRAGAPRPELEQGARTAKRTYFYAIRQARKDHWENFLADDANIWTASKYLDPSKSAAFARVPPLQKPQGDITNGNEEIAENLLNTFFPALPNHIESEREQSWGEPIANPEITVEEVHRAITKMSPWKAPGEDGLPAATWQTSGRW
jgi:hypothetical protein